MRRLTGKRLFAWLSTGLAVISMARVLVLFLEAVAVVRDERGHDSELLELCTGGAARGSAKMRSACLQAQAERASPLLLKAVVRAVSTAWKEFSETVASPFGFASMVLFVISSLLLPVVPWVKAILTAWAGDEEDEQDLHRDSDLETHVIVLNGDQSWMPPRPGMRKKLARRIVGMPSKIRASPGVIGNDWNEGGVQFSEM